MIIKKLSLHPTDCHYFLQLMNQLLPWLSSCSMSTKKTTTCFAIFDFDYKLNFGFPNSIVIISSFSLIFCFLYVLLFPFLILSILFFSLSKSYLCNLNYFIRCFLLFSPCYCIWTLINSLFSKFYNPSEDYFLSQFLLISFLIFPLAYSSKFSWNLEQQSFCSFFL